MKGVVVLELFRNYQLIEAGDGYDLILYIDTEMNDVEFAGEFGRIDDDNKNRLNKNIMESIRDKFPGIKINTVKIMAGTMLLSSFLMVAPVTAKAAEPPTSGITQAQSAYNYNVRVMINGSLQTFRTRPFIYNDTTYVPMYDFGNAIGGSVWWNNASNTVGINKNDTMIAFVRGSARARVNGVQMTMPPSIVIGSTTYVPVRFIAEHLGYRVTMNSATGTVEISNTATASGNSYKVTAGESLWSISRRFGISVDQLKRANNLTSDIIFAGQTLLIPRAAAAPSPAPAPAPAADTEYNNTKWPDVTYIVQPGDTASSIAKKFGTTEQNILRFNYMDENEWFEAGERVAISGYAPRVTTVYAGQDAAPAQRGALVDWNLEGKYLLERGDTFTVTDVDTGRQFRARMIGGYNHADIEPLTAADTTVMRSMFGTWQWSPRAVVIYHDGINMAASLSGMPHGVDTIENGINGHFDLYMQNSSSHSTSTSQVYIQEHQNMVMKAAGQ
jgi:LysM repeat protein